MRRVRPTRRGATRSASDRAPDGVRGRGEVRRLASHARAAVLAQQPVVAAQADDLERRSAIPGDTAAADVLEQAADQGGSARAPAVSVRGLWRCASCWRRTATGGSSCSSGSRPRRRRRGDEALEMRRSFSRGGRGPRRAARRRSPRAFARGRARPARGGARRLLRVLGELGEGSAAVSSSRSTRGRRAFDSDSRDGALGGGAARLVAALDGPRPRALTRRRPLRRLQQGRPQAAEAARRAAAAGLNSLPDEELVARPTCRTTWASWRTSPSVTPTRCGTSRAGCGRPVVGHGRFVVLMMIGPPRRWSGWPAGEASATAESPSSPRG